MGGRKAESTRGAKLEKRAKENTERRRDIRRIKTGVNIEYDESFRVMDKLKEAQRLLGLTGKQMSFYMGITETLWSEWTTGLPPCDTGYVRRVKKLAASLNDLLDDIREILDEEHERILAEGDKETA